MPVMLKVNALIGLSAKGAVPRSRSQENAAAKEGQFQG